MTMIETVIALGILLTVATSVMSIGVVAIGTTENQGHLAARTAEYAQDKMEELNGLLFCNGDNVAPCPLGLLPSGTNTTVFPATCCTGTGLLVGGNSNPVAPVVGYVDYLDANGNLLGGGAVAPANWYYIRVWQISNPPGTVNSQCNGAAVGPTIKQIAVTSRVRFGVGSRGYGGLPQSTVTMLKTCPF